MANKALKKKPKRRLKKTVRRSVAALLMATAIAVAAIPVPDNRAEELYPTMASEEKHVHEELPSYEELAKGFVNSGAADVNDKFQLPKTLNSNNFIGTNEELLSNPSVYRSLKLNDVGGGKYSLDWEFLYHVDKNPISGASGGIICGYNNQYSVANINLSATPNINYFMVSKESFDKYFEDGTSPAGIKMTMKPTDSVSYLYSDFIGTTVLDEKTKYFFENYATDSFNDKKKQYEQYQKELEQYNKDLEQYKQEKQEFENNPENTGKLFPKQEPTKPTEPAALEGAMNDFLAPIESRKRFFADYCKTLSDLGTGYTLVDAYDKISGGSNGATEKIVYLAQGGNPTGAGTKNDDQGFLVTEQGQLVFAIGKHAFKFVDNAESVSLPQQIGYIGDEAFAGNNSIKSIVIDSVALIGDHAFDGCTQLSSVTMNNGVTVIGREAFKDCKNLTSVSFPSTLKKICNGAFANCEKLGTVNMNSVSVNCEIGDAAFYDCAALSNVAISSSAVTSIGEAAFAAVSGTVLSEFLFPGNTTEIGDFMFAGRSSLKKVVFPKNYGRSKEIQLPKNMFHACTALDVVEFPAYELDGSGKVTNEDATACGMVSFDKYLFADVKSDQFYVKGPKLDQSGKISKPRKSTWGAITAGNNNRAGFVPYLYAENGKEYFEISSDSDGKGGYLECINKETGILTSVSLAPDASVPNGVLEIPDMVGDTVVTGIASGCFEDEEMTKSVSQIIINNNIQIIEPFTFKNNDNDKWKSLESVVIGSGITSIGEEAFYGCKNLEDITFKTPLEGNYSALAIDANAFYTGSEKLTIHGDIVKGYAPYEYAVATQLYKEGDIDVINFARVDLDRRIDGVHIMYQSRWDSPGAKNMSVLYGTNQDGEGFVTLVDYPKYRELIAEADKMGSEVSDYCEAKEIEYYEEYSAPEYDRLRNAFSILWEKKGDYSLTYDDIRESDTVLFGEISKLVSEEDLARYEGELYGPWVGPDYCENYVPYVIADNGSSNPLYHMLFDPLVAEAAVGKPAPYFSLNSYNFIDNYENNNDKLNIADYKSASGIGLEMIYATKEIVVPEGIDSIDIVDFYKSPKNSVSCEKYGIKTNPMYTSTSDGAVPGLFSGFYEDYSNSELEQNKRGNDVILSVTLNSVKYLPDYAFDDCEQLDSVTIGPACTKIGTLPFRGCSNLYNVTGNSKFLAENGVIYEDKGEEGYRVIECLLSRGRFKTGSGSGIEEKNISPSNDSLLAGVTEIDESAFEDCSEIALVDLRETNGISMIPENCFNNCTSLTEVLLPASVNKIRDDAFSNIATPAHGLKVTIYGKEVDISDIAFEPKNNVTIRTYEDSSAYRYGMRYKEAGTGMNVSKLDAYTVRFYDYDWTQIGDEQVIELPENAPVGYVPKAVPPSETELAVLKDKTHRPGYTFTGEWLGTNKETLDDPITQDTIFIAQYTSDGTMIDGKYTVKFFDGLDASNLYNIPGATYVTDENLYVYYVEPGASFDALGWPEPRKQEHKGAEFLGWYYEGGEKWDLNTAIDNNMTVIALYKSSGGSGTGGGSSSGGSTGTSKGSSNSGGNNSSSGNSSNTSNKSTSGSSNSSNSSNNTSTTSGSNTNPAMYTVTVENGSGSGSYAVGSTVIIAANTPATGKVFSKWTTESNGVNLASVSMTATTFVMPANNVTVVANYIADTAANTNNSNNGSNSNSNSSNSNSGNTVVDITKPGISNKDLANAHVNGSADNYIVKITETDEATAAVAQALTNMYGSLDNILYYAMDISLYDSTGTTKITDTSGISVDITIPIPDALLPYGGNNQAGAVINGDGLENLAERFTTINGVPCISFTATHFSPYTVYVDTGNLTEGALDYTPKTGDPIHPKWFLSIGLACLSLLLFMKKDRVPAKARV